MISSQEMGPGLVSIQKIFGALDFLSYLDLTVTLRKCSLPQFELAL